jgi:hypothetical protein
LPFIRHIDTRRLQTLAENNSTTFEFTSHLESAASKASAFWSQHLSTVPVVTDIEITSEQCPLAFDSDGGGDWHVFSEADLVIYLFADEGPCLGENPPIAFSDECAMVS